MTSSDSDWLILDIFCELSFLGDRLGLRFGHRPLLSLFLHLTFSLDLSKHVASVHVAEYVLLLRIIHSHVVFIHLLVVVDNSQFHSTSHVILPLASSEVT